MREFSSHRKGQEILSYERRTENALRPICDSFHEWIYGDYWEPGCAEEDASSRGETSGLKATHPTYLYRSD